MKFRPPTVWIQFDPAASAGFVGPNQRSIEPSLFVATLLNPLVYGSSCGVSGIVPSVTLYAVTAQKSAAGGSGGRWSL